MAGLEADKGRQPDMSSSGESEADTRFDTVDWTGAPLLTGLLQPICALWVEITVIQPACRRIMRIGPKPYHLGIRLTQQMTKMSSTLRK